MPPSVPPTRIATEAALAARLAELRGIAQLAVDGVHGVTDLVEQLHHTILSLAPPIAPARRGTTRGITGFVYRRVRDVTHGVGWAIDTALSPFAGAPAPRTLQAEAVLSALNGVLGDHLAARGNPLAIPMSLRRDGRELDVRAQTGRRLLVLVHGLCMNDRQWRRDGHDHGEALAAEHGYVPLYLRYNTGRPIADNGAELAALLQALVDSWPEPIERLAIVGHSMGGLVARSACAAARRDGLGWLAQLDRMVFLGTPHDGAPLERIGHWVDRALGVSPYTAPFVRIGGVRSAGIQDLRHGHIGDADSDAAWPRGVRCYAIAGTRDDAQPLPARPRGDGLVPVDSALGKRLRLPRSQRAICAGVDHFQLLGDATVYRQLAQWLGNVR